MGYSARAFAHSSLFRNLWNVAKASLNSINRPSASEMNTASVMLASAVSSFARLARKISIPWLFHSDGDVTELLDDFVELGIRAIQPVEPAAMDIREEKRRYGTRLCLCGNVDMDLLSRGTPRQVDETVRGLIRDIAPGGGYIVTSGNSLAHYVLPENAIAMSDAVHAYGAYPISV